MLGFLTLFFLKVRFFLAFVVIGGSLLFSVPMGAQTNATRSATETPYDAVGEQVAKRIKNFARNIGIVIGAAMALVGAVRCAWKANNEQPFVKDVLFIIGGVLVLGGVLLLTESIADPEAFARLTPVQVEQLEQYEGSTAVLIETAVG